MNLFKKSFAAIACAAALVAGASAAQAGETLRIATEGAFPPFNYIDKTGTPGGFDVDIAKALCAEMNRECEIVTQDWDGIIPGLLAKKYDAIVASMSITPERQESVAFTDPYYTNKFYFAGAKDREFDLSKDGLKDLVIGAQRATVSASWLEDNLGSDYDIKLYGTFEEALLDLSSGRLDVVLNDVYVLHGWLNKPEGQAFELKGEPVIADDKVGIALRKGDDALKAEFNKALAAIVENGTYEKINAKYFPFSIY